jgi:DnaJ-class molecular chaperone
MNLPKYASKDQIKKQYHKLAKIYHPDILSGKASQMLSAG